MKVYSREIEIFNIIKKVDYLKLDHTQVEKIERVIGDIRRKRSKLKDFSLQLTPFVIYLSFIYIILFLTLNIDSQFLQMIFLSFFHGVIGYFYVIYALHEGAGHGLFNKNSFLNNLAFNSARIFFADPKYYRSIHSKHHRYLGTENDSAFTNFILLKRFYRSIIPGAGILFKNDFCVHTDSNLTTSLIKSFFFGLVFFSIEFIFLSKNMNGFLIVLSLLVFSPWVGMVLDRLREIAEHHNMPADRLYGSRELGLKGIMFFIVGGPCGQPYHFSHHFAPDFKWFEQIRLHKEFMKILRADQKKEYGFQRNKVFSIYSDIFLRLKNEGNYV